MERRGFVVGPKALSNHLDLTRGERQAIRGWSAVSVYPASNHHRFPMLFRQIAPQIGDDLGGPPLTEPCGNGFSIDRHLPLPGIDEHFQEIETVSRNWPNNTVHLDRVF